MSGARVGVLGGTFDPIHEGHVAAGRAAVRALTLDRLVLVPSHIPPHRPDSPVASGYHRLQMARLAAATEPGWTASDVELARGGPSYTYDTLTALRAVEPASQFFFITGADAFAEVASWRRYPDVLDLAHFVVIARSGTTLDHVRARLPELAPRLIACDEEDRLPPLAADQPPSVFFVHARTPDISSTDIRQAAAAGASLAGVVPDAVRRYIDTHQLYA